SSVPTTPTGSTGSPGSTGSTGSTESTAKPKPGALPAPTLHGQAPRASAAAKHAAAVTADASAAGPDGVYLTFDTTSTQTVQAKVGISYVSADNAKGNLQAEQPASAFAFDAVRAAGVSAWNTE